AGHSALQRTCGDSRPRLECHNASSVVPPDYKAEEAFRQGGNYQPGIRLNPKIHPRPGRWKGLAKSTSPTANPNRFTRSATPPDATPPRAPPRISGRSPVFHAAPPSAKNATSIGT